MQSQLIIQLRRAGTGWAPWAAYTISSRPLTSLQTFTWIAGQLQYLKRQASRDQERLSLRADGKSISTDLFLISCLTAGLKLSATLHGGARRWKVRKGGPSLLQDLLVVSFIEPLLRFSWGALCVLSETPCTRSFRCTKPPLDTESSGHELCRGSRPRGNASVCC